MLDGVLQYNINAEDIAKHYKKIISAYNTIDWVQSKCILSNEYCGMFEFEIPLIQKELDIFTDMLNTDITKKIKFELKDKGSVEPIYIFRIVSNSENFGVLIH